MMFWFPDISKRLVLILITGFFPFTGFSQSLDFRGYVKELGGLSFSNDLETLHYDNILHHRIETNLSWDNGLEIQVDLRNRLLSGYSVQNTPGYSDFLEQDPGYIDLSWVLFETDHTLFHSTIDRLQLSYYKGPWEFTAGRQRLNWGKSYVWNPNDLFNAYAYLDFDYEERPGTDAVSIAYNWSYASGLQLGYRLGDTLDESVLAAMLRVNIGEYDVQFIAGNYYQQLVAGAGFSGYLRNAGLDGELSYFHPKKDLIDQKGHFTATLGTDYMFANSVFMTGELLYNGGYDRTVNPLAQLSRPPSADDLFISKTGLYINNSLPLSPLTNISAGVLTSFTESIFIFIPQLSYSVSLNIDLLLLAQIFRGSVLDEVTSTPNLLFFRLKWSY